METWGTCPKCGTEIESELEYYERGKCPNCGEEYTINYDCDYEDAVLILDFDYYYRDRNKPTQ